MKKSLLIIFVLIILTNYSYSQLEYSNWYFGKMSGVTFNTANGNPRYLAGNKLSQFEGVATISDRDGNLLLYTNGEFVVNKSGEIVNIGSPMYGHQSSAQSAVILEKPQSQNLYYIFTADAGEYTSEKNRGVNYTIYDIDANSGKGGIVEMNIPLFSPSSELLSAAFHANGEDLWVVARGWKNNNFYAYLLTKDGISDTVVSSIGFNRTSDNNTIGCLKFSPDATIAVATVYERDFFEMYRFNNKTGEFSNILQINIQEQYTLYGAEFSSDGKVLYIANSKNTAGIYTIYQYDISEYDATKIKNSEYIVKTASGHIGTFQRGINDKIYIAPLSKLYLSSIEKPNKLGKDCDYIEQSVVLFDSSSQLGLPQVFNQPKYSRQILICEDESLELDVGTFLEDTVKYEYTYKWVGPNGWESDLPRPFLADLVVADSGDYILTATFVVDSIPITMTYKITLKVGKHVRPKIIGEPFICKGDKINIGIDTINANFTYTWNTGQISPIISVSEEGLYKLNVMNEYGCLDSAEFYLTVIDLPLANILGHRLICKNETIELSSEVQGAGYTFEWSTGDTTPSIIVNSTGNYGLVVTNQNGCKDSTKIEIVKYADARVEIKGDTVLCLPGSLSLEALVIPYDSTLKYEYQWSNGDTNSTITVFNPDNYIVTVTIDGHCIYQDSIFVRKADKPKIYIDSENEYELCEGEQLTITLNKKDENVDYKWSDGSRAFPRTLKDAGDYEIIAINESGCISTFPISVSYNPRPVAEIRIDENINICNADSLILRAYPKGDNYTYNWLIGETSDSMVIYHSGLYFLVVTNEFACSDTVSINIQLGKGLPISISGNKIACKGDEIELKAIINVSNTPEGDLTYEWSNGEQSKSIFVSSEGWYSVIVTHSSGCIGYDSIFVSFLEIPSVELNIDSEITICEGEIIEVYPKNKNSNWTYYWWDGSLDSVKYITTSGDYSIYVYNSGACADTINFRINVVENPKISILAEPDIKLCIGEKITLKPSEIRSDYSYEWLNISKIDTVLEVSSSGWYYLKTTNSNSCSYIDSILIIQAIEPSLELIASKPFLCEGDSLFISADGIFSSIIWSSGDTTNQILVKKAGVYSAMAISDDACMVEKSIEIMKFGIEKTLSYELNNFDTICPNKVDINEIILTNNSDIDIIINSVTLLPEGNFELLQNLDGMIILANASLELPVLFSPMSIGDFSAKIFINYVNQCEDSLIIDINASSTIESNFRLPELIVMPGDRICLPIYYNFECVDEVNFTSSPIISLSFDYDAFLPDSVSKGVIIRNEVIGRMRYIDIKFDDYIFAQKEGVLTYLCGTILLGDSIEVPMYIDDFTWDREISTKFESGLLTNELCIIDLRPIKLFKPTELSLSPNPVNDFINITINSEEKGIFALEIINYSGMLISTFEWSRSESSAKQKKFNISTSDLSSGVYVVRLISPWNIISTKAIIIK